MCHISCLSFVQDCLDCREINGKSVIEVGALDVNGSVRPVICRAAPRIYLGIDLADGRGVDLVCDINDVENALPNRQFDIVVSTEMLEHVSDWRAAVNGLKSLVAENGLLIVTTRSIGFHYHPYPTDNWRFEINDFRKIFADHEIKVLLSDPQAPGIQLLARKRDTQHRVDLSQIEVYAMPESAQACLKTDVS